MARYQPDRKKKRKNRRIYNGLMVFFALVFAVSAFSLIRHYMEEKRDGNLYQGLQDRFPTAAPLPSATALPQSTPGPSGEVNTPAPTPTPLSEEELRLQVYADLHAENEDMVGWLKIDGTVIDYPVMHTPEDEEYYLRRNFYGERSTGGTLFVAAASTIEPQSDNIIIYGHNMNAGTMFADLHKYKQEAFYREHPIVRFDTLTEVAEYQIIGVIQTDVSIDNPYMFRYFEFINAEDEADFNSFIKQMKRLCYYDTGVTAEYGDKLISLSTCEYSTANGRLVVIAKKLSPEQ